MAEHRRWRWPLVLLALGLGLAWLPLIWNAPLALSGLVLAQPFLLLGWSGWRGSRKWPGTGFPFLADLPSVILLWSLAFTLLALIVAWPLQALLDNGALVPALVLSLCTGFVLLALWRLWPAFAQAARHGQSFGALLTAATRAGQVDLLRGVVITLLVFCVLALGLGLIWPGVVPAVARLPMLVAYPLLALLAHMEIHRRADRLATSAVPAVLPTPVLETV
ncbi:MAG: hypothetical protein ABIW30_05365, partial [Arenimonas sp.]